MGDDMRRATSSLLFIVGFNLFVPIAGAQTFDKDVSALVDKVAARAIEIRHDIHQHPELSLEEVQTSKYIADLVRSWGYEVAEGIGQHGVVASLTVGDGAKSIGLRADTDALNDHLRHELPSRRTNHLSGGPFGIVKPG
jgi:metal-dependent amidase/aminoacylase/carboxypeptidase family protein